MVSHSQIFERTLAHRAPSTSTRSVTSRRHRSSRSQSGGGTYRPQNEFPNFAQTGDVEIVIIADGQERKYMLHRLILVQNSGFFEASTSEDWSRAQENSQPSGVGTGGRTSYLGSISEDSQDSGGGTATFGNRHGDKRIWRYELDWGSKDDEVPMLVQRQPQSTLFGGGDYNSRPPAVPNKPSTQAGLLQSMSNYSAMQSASYIPSTNPQNNGPDSDIIRDYDNLFRVFYNYPPSLDAVNIAEAYIQCKSLLTLADMYDALEVVGPRIDHHLLQFQSRLWKQIAKYPPSYLKLGFLARSKVIFAEALVHVVGQWPAGINQLRHTVPETVLDLIEDKVDELSDRRMKAEARLYRIGLTTSKGDRVGPANSYIDWLALSIFRQWLMDSTTPPPPIPKTGPAPNISNTSTNSTSDSSRNQSTHSQAPATTTSTIANPKPPLSTGSFYRLLAAGGSSYLAHDECKRILRTARLAFTSTSSSSDDHGGGGGGASSGGSTSREREALKKLERRLDEVKSQAREIVKGLVKNYLELDVSRDAPGGRLGYLTCTKVEEDDFPWD